MIQRNTMRELPRPSTLRGGWREHHETILRRLAWPANGSPSPLEALGVTSCHAGEGVSTVAARLAAAAASLGNQDILLVDAHFAEPTLHETFCMEPKAGLAEALLERVDLSELVRPTSVEHLSLLGAGLLHAESCRAYDAACLAETVEALKGRFGLVIFDLPPVARESAAVRLASLLDGVLLVVEAERVRWQVARRTKKLLTRAGAPVLGAVLNKRRQHIPSWLYRTW